MRNFKISHFLLLICLVQLVVTLGYGLVVEDGDFGAAGMYPLVFFLPAVLIHFVYGFLIILINLKNRTDRLVFLLLFLTVAFLVVNEFLHAAGFVLFRYAIAAAGVTSGLYFYSVLKKTRRQA